VAPPELRSTAQGLITLATYGLGMLIGSLLSGGVLDYFSTTTADGNIVRNWQSFWLSSAGMSFAITLLVLFFFRSSVRVRSEQSQPGKTAEATA
jgi:MFS family permease